MKVYLETIRRAKVVEGLGFREIKSKRRGGRQLKYTIPSRRHGYSSFPIKQLDGRGTKQSQRLRDQ
jgi:hypothetical protein